MSECTNGELRDLLPELVNGRLSAAMQRTVEAHVAACTECAEELALLRSLRPALTRAPAIDTHRIAAAVQARTAGTARHLPSRAGVTTRVTTRWRVAIAAAALIAVSALGYVARTHRATGAQSVAVTEAPRDGANDTSNRELPVPETVHAPLLAPPRSAPVQTHGQEVAVAPPQAAVPSTVASTGVLDNLSDLSDDDVRTLTASLDKLSSIPGADPSPGIDPLGASLDELSAGGAR
jgi:anti-sigma factor RsiW